MLYILITYMLCIIKLNMYQSYNIMILITNTKHKFPTKDN